ncbi:Short chain dehydrogenase-like protein 60 [Elsinoe fawcettii]|nr:Short chain dehydrogenase-like protein 60 [Elsinoe fawcettii]
MPTTQTAIIIGVGPFISRSLALHLASQSYSIGLITRSESTLFSLSSEISSLQPTAKIHTYAADASNTTSLLAALDALKTKLSHVDVLIYNAARVQPVPLLTTSPDVFLDDFRISAIGTLVAGQWFATNAPSSTDGAKPLFIVTGGVLDKEPNAFVSSLTAAKAASQAISRMFATELSEKGILVGMPLIVDPIAPKEGGGWQTKSDPDVIVKEIFVPFLEGRKGGKEWQVERVW